MTFYQMPSASCKTSTERSSKKWARRTEVTEFLSLGFVLTGDCLKLDGKALTDLKLELYDNSNPLKEVEYSKKLEVSNITDRAEVLEKIRGALDMPARQATSPY